MQGRPSLVIAPRLSTILSADIIFVVENGRIVYGESLTSAFYIDKPDETALYAQALDRISAQAAPARETAGILRKIRKEI